MPDDLRLEAALAKLVMLGNRMAALLTTLAQDECVQTIYRRHAERDTAAWHAAMDELNDAAIARAAESPPTANPAETAIA